jgi:hypothetical protein
MEDDFGRRISGQRQSISANGTYVTKKGGNR